MPVIHCDAVTRDVTQIHGRDQHIEMRSWITVSTVAAGGLRRPAGGTWGGWGPGDKAERKSDTGLSHVMREVRGDARRDVRRVRRDVGGLRRDARGREEGCTEGRGGTCGGK